MSVSILAGPGITRKELHEPLSHAHVARRARRARWSSSPPRTRRRRCPKLTGTVGPGFTITLKRLGKFKTIEGRHVLDHRRGQVEHPQLPPAWAGSVNKEITQIGFVGTKTVIVKLVKGTYTFICDPHFTTMKGSFKVT